MYVKYVMSTETPYLDKIFIENLMIGVKKKSSNFGTAISIRHFAVVVLILGMNLIVWKSWANANK